MDRYLMVYKIIKNKNNIRILGKNFVEKIKQKAPLFIMRKNFLYKKK